MKQSRCIKAGASIGALNAFVFGLVLLALGCDKDGDKGVDLSKLSDDQVEAYKSAQDPDDTHALNMSSGSVAGVRESMMTEFPQVAVLVTGGDDVRVALEETFEGKKSYSDDIELAIFAYFRSRCRCRLRPGGL